MLIICMLCSCGGHHYPTSLLTADSLTEVNPDSAVALLRQLSPQMQDERKAVRMYHRLLTVKAADKADQLQPVPDSILPIVKYYERRGDKRLLSTAYYYAGRTYYELHDAPQALDYFQKAILVTDKRSSLYNIIYSNIGYIFMHQGLYDEAKASFAEQYNNALNNHDTLDMIYGLRDISIALDS
ncbi:MAG: tetratricopeptide repeat protein, partial [Prevotella sp.]|nr:tetratricopeptide repeat protein [Prevotella sp.]